MLIVGARPGRVRRRRRETVAWTAIIAIAGVYLAYLGISIAVAIDPVGVGGVSSPDGLEGLGVVLSVIAFPFVAIAIALIYFLGIRRGRGTETNRSSTQ